MKNLVLSIAIALLLITNVDAKSYYASVVAVKWTGLSGSWYARVQEGSKVYTVYQVDRIDWSDYTNLRTGTVQIESYWSEGEHTWTMTQGDTVFNITRVVSCREYKVRGTSVCPGT